MNNSLLRQVIEVELIIYKGLAILIVGLAVSMGALFDGLRWNRVAILCFVAIATSLLFVHVSQLNMYSRLASEQYTNHRAIANCLACWPQFNTVEEWRAFAQQEHEREKQLSRPLRSTIIMWLWLCAVYGVLCAAGVGASFWIFWGAVAALIVGVSYSTLAQRNNQSVSALIFMHRLVSQPPRVYLCKDGIYDEDTGYRPFRTLKQVSFVVSLVIDEFPNHPPETINNPPNTEWLSSEWSYLYFLATYTSSSRSATTYRIHDTIYIPPGCEAEAEQIAQGFQAKVPKKLPSWW